jgi:formate dehydrogenase maturation protein FdhE
MPENPWQRRATRAGALAAEYPFAAEILNFYVQVAQFQQRFYRDLETAIFPGNTTVSSFSSPSKIPPLVSSFGPFLSLVHKAGPTLLSQIAADLQRQGSDAWSELLNSCWLTLNGSSASPSQLLGNAFLQPYAELLRDRSAVQWKGYTHSLCPFCSRKPVAGVLRQKGEGAARSLLCGFCLAEWEFRRIVCPACGEEDNRKLPVYTAEQFTYLRVECCDTCRTYLKSVDLSKNGLAEPLVDEIASAPLDLWAHEQGYAKLRANLLGM